jgi:hypothetical protein
MCDGVSAESRRSSARQLSGLTSFGLDWLGWVMQPSPSPFPLPPCLSVPAGFSLGGSRNERSRRLKSKDLPQGCTAGLGLLLCNTLHSQPLGCTVTTSTYIKSVQVYLFLFGEIRGETCRVLGKITLITLSQRRLWVWCYATQGYAMLWVEAYSAHDEDDDDDDERLFRSPLLNFHTLLFTQARIYDMHMGKLGAIVARRCGRAASLSSSGPRRLSSCRGSE